MIKFIETLLVGLVLVASQAGATNYAGYSVTATNFTMKPGVAGFGTIGDVRYSPTGSTTQDVIAAMMHAQPNWLALYWMGYPEGSPIGAHGFSHFETLATNGSSLTGTSGYPSTRYTPWAASNHSLKGNMFVEASPTKGIGMYVISDSSSFMAVKRYGTGTSPDRQEIYVSMLADDTQFKVFAGATKTMRIATKQQVGRQSVGSTGNVMQKYAVVLYNATSGKKFEYTVQTFNTSGNNGPRVSYDIPTGLFYAGGGFIGSGVHESITDPASGWTAGLWKANAAGTQSTTFPLTTFSIDVTWTDFVQTMRYVVYKEGLDGQNTAHVSSIFGADWDIRGKWRLYKVRSAQEIHNPDYATQTAMIAGRAQEMTVDAI